jgi:hypothetical protein
MPIHGGLKRVDALRRRCCDLPSASPGDRLVAVASGVLCDVARLSPLKFKNLNVLGRYSFTPSTPRQGLRPLRDPDGPELGEDDDALD